MHTGHPFLSYIFHDYLLDIPLYVYFKKISRIANYYLFEYIRFFYKIASITNIFENNYFRKYQIQRENSSQ